MEDDLVVRVNELTGVTKEEISEIITTMSLQNLTVMVTLVNKEDSEAVKKLLLDNKESEEDSEEEF